MVQEGWIDEVENLLGTEWEAFFKQKKLIGYDTIVDYLRGDKRPEQLEETIQIIQKKTRNYAKRQVTFWRSFEEQLQEAVKKASIDEANGRVQTKIETIDLTLSDPEVYIEKLVKYLSNLFE